MMRSPGLTSTKVDDGDLEWVDEIVLTRASRRRQGKGVVSDQTDRIIFRIFYANFERLTDQFVEDDR
jgi:hypothetical protein